MSMKAVRLHDKGDLRFEMIDRPSDPASDEVRVKVAYAGICGSDIHNYKTGQWISRKPSTAGHEFSGWIDAIGDDVQGFSIGDKIAADSRVYCSTCRNCRTNRPHLCDNLGFVGEAIDGGFAEYVNLPAHLALKCQDDAPMDIMALAEPLAVALHALRQVDLDLDSPLLVIGCGPIGALIAVAARLSSNREIFVCDKNHQRQTQICEMAQAKTVSLDDFDPFEISSTGPVAHIIDTTGHIGVLSHLVAHCSGCKIGLVGIGSGELALDPVHLVERELSLIGCHAFHDQLPDAISFLQSHPDRFEPIIGARLDIEETVQAYHDIIAGTSEGVKTLMNIGGQKYA